MISVTVVGDDDSFVTLCFSSFDYVFHASVNSHNSLLDCFVDTGMTNHVTVSEVHHDEIIFVFVDSVYQFILHFVSAHFRFQVVSGYFRRWNKDTVFVVERSFTTAVEEESNVSIFLCFSDMELAQSFGSDVFAQCVGNVFLVEQDVNTFEGCIIRSHAVILQSRNRMHTRFRHILLSQYDSQFFSTVVTVVEEDNDITFFDGSVAVGVYNRLDEFVRYTFIVRFLHSLNHIGSFLTLAVYQQVIGFLHTFPTFVTVHSIITSDDRSDLACRFLAVCRKFFDKSLATLRVSVTTVHEAVDECIVDAVFFGDVAKFEKMNH